MKAATPAAKSIQKPAAPVKDPTLKMKQLIK